MEANKLNFGRLYSLPEWKAALRVANAKRQEAIDELLSIRASDTERVAAIQERVRFLDWLLSEPFESEV